MTTLRLLCTIALQRAIERCAADFTAATGITLALECGATAALLERIRAGERADLAVLTDDGAATMVHEGLLAAPGTEGATVPLVRSYIGMAVRAGAPHPDISNLEQFVAALHAARSLVISQAGASGLFMQEFLARTGLAATILPKTTILPAGFTAALVADGRAQYAFQQVSELLSVDGIDIVGRLPDGAQSPAMFAAGAFTASPQRAAAATLLTFLQGPGAAPALERYGLERQV